MDAEDKEIIEKVDSKTSLQNTVETEEPIGTLEIVSESNLSGNSQDSQGDKRVTKERRKNDNISNEEDDEEKEEKMHVPHDKETSVIEEMEGNRSNVFAFDRYTDTEVLSGGRPKPTSLWSNDSDDDDSDMMYPETDEEVQRAQKLFSIVMDSERIKMTKFSSMLINGFALRNYPSLCRALEHQYKLDQEYKERKRKSEEEELERMKQYRELEHAGEYRGESGASFSNLGSQTDFSSFTASTHHDTTAEQRRRIEYLMGLHSAGDAGWEEAGTLSTPSMINEIKEDDLMSCGPEKEEPLTGSSDAMRQAQQYLRTHRIFEFFQFLTVHLLSKVPENPVEYLLLLLDKLLVYRSGFGTPPLHYKKRHLEELFYLMDRMRTGFIDMQQYRTGMNTIGLKCFNNIPPLNDNGQVPKEFFIEEAYQCASHVLNNIIRVRKPDRALKNKLNSPADSKRGRRNYKTKL